jgi:hypothetical protein
MISLFVGLLNEQEIVSIFGCDTAVNNNVDTLTHPTEVQIVRSGLLCGSRFNRSCSWLFCTTTITHSSTFATVIRRELVLINRALLHGDERWGVTFTLFVKRRRWSAGTGTGSGG